jgi:hypothetical protein
VIAASAVLQVAVFPAKKNVPLEQNRVVAALLQSRNKCEAASHEATKLPPRCLIDVTNVNNGDYS